MTHGTVTGQIATFEKEMGMHLETSATFREMPGYSSARHLHVGLAQVCEQEYLTLNLPQVVNSENTTCYNINHELNHVISFDQ